MLMEKVRKQYLLPLAAAASVMLGAGCKGDDYKQRFMDKVNEDLAKHISETASYDPCMDGSTTDISNLVGLTPYMTLIREPMGNKSLMEVSPGAPIIGYMICGSEICDDTQVSYDRIAEIGKRAGVNIMLHNQIAEKMGGDSASGYASHAREGSDLIK